jgi:hypothetical protein
MSLAHLTTPYYYMNGLKRELLKQALPKFLTPQDGK